MPLLSGKENIGKNISELSKSQTKAGKKRTQKQNIAIALKKAGVAKKKTKRKSVKRKVKK